MVFRTPKVFHSSLLRWSWGYIGQVNMQRRNEPERFWQKPSFESLGKARGGRHKAGRGTRLLYCRLASREAR